MLCDKIWYELTKCPFDLVLLLLNKSWFEKKNKQTRTVDTVNPKGSFRDILSWIRANKSAAMQTASRAFQDCMTHQAVNNFGHIVP